MVSKRKRADPMYLLDGCLKFLVTVIVNPYMKRIQNFGAMKTFHSKDKWESKFINIDPIQSLKLLKLFVGASVKPCPDCSDRDDWVRSAKLKRPAKSGCERIFKFILIRSSVNY